MLVLEGENQQLYDRIQEHNLIRQYSLLTNCIEIGLEQGPMAFDKYTIWALNHTAVANISQFGGRYRQEPIYVGEHIPPHFKEVSELIDRFVSFIHENWHSMSATQLAAYGLWRLNWIHPFVDGNGRTARAVCYYLMSVRIGALLPGSKIVPERIKENRDGYEKALRMADAAWDDGHLNISEMEEFLAGLLKDQLRNVGPATSGSNPTRG